MREIKFKAWLNGNMLPVLQLGWNPDGTLTNAVQLKPGGVLSDAISSEYQLLQFTGVVDKNDQEIYDGDILSHHQWGLAVVTWDVINNRWVYYNLDENLYAVCASSISGGKMHDSEVIGNRWENPELVPEDVRQLL